MSKARSLLLRNNFLETSAVTVVDHLVVYRPMSKLTSNLLNLRSPASNQRRYIPIFHSPMGIISYVGEFHVLPSQVHKFMRSNC